MSVTFVALTQYNFVVSNKSSYDYLLLPKGLLSAQAEDQIQRLCF
jgi:hypothetical protein